jgi:polyisoprenoid-binding protein YceI
MKALQPQVERLKGERDLLEKENKKLKEKFSETKSNFEEYNVHKTLFKMDPQRYGQTIGDLNQRPESYPIWADIDFLERANTHENGDTVRQTSTDVNIEIKQLRFEIMKLRHENKDFAAELDKAQNLLRLQ